MTNWLLEAHAGTEEKTPLRELVGCAHALGEEHCLLQALSAKDWGARGSRPPALHSWGSEGPEQPSGKRPATRNRQPVGRGLGKLPVFLSQQELGPRFRLHSVGAFSGPSHCHGSTPGPQSRSQKGESGWPAASLCSYQESRSFPRDHG